MEVDKTIEALREARNAAQKAFAAANAAYQDATNLVKQARVDKAFDDFEAQGFKIGETLVLVHMVGHKDKAPRGPYFVSGFKFASFGVDAVVPVLRKAKKNGTMSMAAPVYSNTPVERYVAFTEVKTNGNK